MQRGYNYVDNMDLAVIHNGKSEKKSTYSKYLLRT